MRPDRLPQISLAEITARDMRLLNKNTGRRIRDHRLGNTVPNA